MDAVKFIKEKERMCEKYRDCKGCGLDKLKSKYDTICRTVINKRADEAVEVVEKWSKDNPLVTNLDKFSEVMYDYFGITVDKTKVSCPPPNKYAPCEESCSECKKWWYMEYEEPKTQ